MNKRVDLLASNATGLAEARSLLEAVFGVSLVTHESEYHGGEYLRFASDEFNIILKKNFEEDGELVEAEHVEGGLLLYLTGDAAAVARLGALASQQGFNVLRSNSY